MKNKINIVLSTCPDAATARRLGGGLVEAGLAACVNVVPGLTSIYRWQGSLCEDGEALMIIKTASAQLPALTDWLRTHHPYELPEIVAVPVTAGHPDYLSWVAGQTDPPEPSA